MGFKKNKIQWLCLSTIFCCLTNTAYATGEGFYTGVLLGYSNINNDPKTVTGNTTTTAPGSCPPPSANYTVTPITTSNPPNMACQITNVQTNVSPNNTGFGGRLYIGGNFNKYAGMELGYTHYQASEYNANELDPPKHPEIQENAIDLVAKGQIPLDPFGLFAKVGMAYVRSTAGGSLTEPSSSGKRTGTTNNIRPTVSIGSFYDFTPNWEGDVTASIVPAGGNGFRDAELIGIGVSYHFVTLYCGQFIC